MANKIINENVEKFTSTKKKKKARKNLLLITILLIISSVLFITKTPYFNIKAIEIEGTSHLREEELKTALSNVIGQNIFLIDQESVLEVIYNDPYIKDAELSKRGINKLSINIEEEAPVYYIVDGDTYKVINDDLEIVEEITDLSSRNLVEVKGISGSNPNLGEKIEVDEIYINILKKFYPYVAENKESIKLEYLDITDIVDIKGRIGNVEIFFGDDSNVHNKMENVYRIVLSEEVGLTSGYIDVSFDGAPVIKRS